MIKGKILIAFDGTHASGKTTLKYLIAAKLKEIGINCVVLPEPARNSVLVDDVVLRNKGNFDIPLEVDLIMNHISLCIRGARDGDIILSDRTPVNVLAYTKLLVDSSDEMESGLLERCESLVEKWIEFYDLVFYCQDFYQADISKDNLRSKVVGIQSDVDSETRNQYDRFGCNLQFISKGLSSDEKANFVLNVMQSKLDLEKYK